MDPQRRTATFQLTSQRTPTDKRHEYPDQIRVSVQCPALHQIRALAATPFQHAPECQRHKYRVSIDQSCSSRKQSEVIGKVSLALICQVLTYCACEEQDHDHGRCDPKGTVQVWVAFEHIEEVRSRVKRVTTSIEDGCGVDIEELLVELDRPEVTFGG